MQSEIEYECKKLIESAETDFEEEVFRMFANTFKEKRYGTRI